MEVLNFQVIVVYWSDYNLLHSSFETISFHLDSLLLYCELVVSHCSTVNSWNRQYNAYFGGTIISNV